MQYRYYELDVAIDAGWVSDKWKFNISNLLLSASHICICSKISVHLHMAYTCKCISLKWCTCLSTGLICVWPSQLITNFHWTRCCLTFFMPTARSFLPQCRIFQLKTGPTAGVTDQRGMLTPPRHLIPLRHIQGSVLCFETNHYLVSWPNYKKFQQSKLKIFWRRLHVIMS
jgi:hypothetical protein